MFNKINAILKFASSPLSILSQAQYLNDSQRQAGHQTGVARLTLHNKVLRQSTSMFHALGLFVNRMGSDVLNDTDSDVTFNVLEKAVHNSVMKQGIYNNFFQIQDVVDVPLDNVFAYGFVVGSTSSNFICSVTGGTFDSPMYKLNVCVQIGLGLHMSPPVDLYTSGVGSPLLSFGQAIPYFFTYKDTLIHIQYDAVIGKFNIINFLVSYSDESVVSVTKHSTNQIDVTGVDNDNPTSTFYDQERELLFTTYFSGSQVLAKIFKLIRHPVLGNITVELEKTVVLPDGCYNYRFHNDDLLASDGVAIFVSRNATGDNWEKVFDVVNYPEFGTSITGFCSNGSVVVVYSDSNEITPWYSSDNLATWNKCKSESKINTGSMTSGEVTDITVKNGMFFGVIDLTSGGTEFRRIIFSKDGITFKLQNFSAKYTRTLTGTKQISYGGGRWIVLATGQTPNASNFFMMSRVNNRM